MRLSRPRVVLRVALLSAGGVFLLVRAVQGWRAAAPGDALAPSLAIVQALVAVLALLTAAAAASSLRRRRREPTLKLREPFEPPRAPIDR